MKIKNIISNFFHSKEKTSKKNGIYDFLYTLFLALICASIVRSFLFEPFHIPSSSMKPNLLIGDYIFVSKYSYGYSKYSIPFGSSINLFDGRIFKSEPKRGDVAVFRLPSDPNINYIKRIIGLPHDKIQMINGVLYINDEEVKKVLNGVFLDDDMANQITSTEFSETLSDGREYLVLDQSITSQDNTGIYEVPKGHYFMMGDNRDNSQDSRFLDHVGYVLEENLVGKAQVIFFSNPKPIWQFWTWYKSIRFDRIFKKIS